MLTVTEDAKQILKEKLLANTDDPEMFGNTLAQEYRLLEQELGFSRSQTRQLILNGIEASWMPPARKQLMQQNFQTDPAWSEK